MSEHTQVGPYALGLLDPLEMSRFEEHLAECDECGTQLEWMLPVADYLADVEPGDLFGIEGPSAFSAPAGSVQPLLTATEPTVRTAPPEPPAEQPGSYAPLRELHAPRNPNELSPAAGPWTGEVPRIDPRTGEMPRVDPRTGEMPRVDPRTGSIPRVDPRTGSIPRVDPRTGSIPRVDPRTGSIPRMDPRTGEIPVGPPPGENRIVPLVRGGDSRRRNQSRPVSRRPEFEESPNRYRPALLIAAAAAVLGAAVGAGAITVGPWANDNTNQGVAIPDAPRDAELIAATDPQTGVHAQVALASKPWGTDVSLTVGEVDGPRNCRLVAILANGKTEVLSSWTVPDQGYNTTTEPPELKLKAATAVNAADIVGLRIQDVSEDGGATTLVTLRA
jgi:hypothetical protein